MKKKLFSLALTLLMLLSLLPAAAIAEETEDIALDPIVLDDPVEDLAPVDDGLAVDRQMLSIPPHEHIFTLYVYNGDATCTKDGTMTSVCDYDGCDATDTRRAPFHPATGHAFFGEAVSNGNGTHSFKCVNPGCSDSEVGTWDFVGGSERCEDNDRDGKCDLCGGKANQTASFTHAAVTMTTKLAAGITKTVAKTVSTVVSIPVTMVSKVVKGVFGVFGLFR